MTRSLSNKDLENLLRVIGVTRLSCLDGIMYRFGGFQTLASALTDFEHKVVAVLQ